MQDLTKGNGNINVQIRFGADNTSISLLPPKYKAVSFPAKNIYPEQFIHSSYSAVILRRIKATIDQEAPISRTILIRRVSQSFGIMRAGSKIQNYFDSILLTLPNPVTYEVDKRFYWKMDQDPENYNGIRSSVAKENYRSVTEVPHQEIVNAICLALQNESRMESYELVCKAANILGYTHMGTLVTSAIYSGIKHAFRDELINEEKDPRGNTTTIQERPSLIITSKPCPVFYSLTPEGIKKADAVRDYIWQCSNAAIDN